MYTLTYIHIHIHSYTHYYNCHSDISIILFCTITITAVYLGASSGLDTNQPVYDEETLKQLLEENSYKLQDEYTLIIDNLEEEIITLRHTLQSDAE